MPNDWFQFKQFLIRQDKTAMKVGTDAVLLGAWAGTGWLLNILDVGTGTGLIALMVAQRFPGALIDAVEIDPESVQQARENVGSSQWRDRIHVIEADFLQWEPDRLYDLIVCNPPFFKDSLKSPVAEKNLIRHDDHLPLTDLIRRSSELLSPGGGLSIVIPMDRLPEAARAAFETGLNLNRILRVKGTVKAPVKRVLIHLGKNYLPVEMNEVAIETEERGFYTETYRELTSEFYLESCP